MALESQAILFSRPLLLISLPFALAGVVNLGFLGFIPSLPFLLFLLLALVDRKNPNQNIALLFFFIALPLYLLKHMQTPVYFPAQGGKVTVREHLCLVTEDGKLRFTPPSKENSCPGKVIPAGTSLRVLSVEISHLNFPERETYHPVVETQQGKVKIERPSSFIAEDGTVLSAQNLRRNFFYGISLLSYFPAPLFFRELPKLTHLFFPSQEEQAFPSTRPVPAGLVGAKDKRLPVQKAVKILARRDWEIDPDAKYKVFKLNLRDILRKGCEGFMKVRTEAQSHKGPKTFGHDGAVRVEARGEHSFVAIGIEGQLVADPTPSRHFQFLEFKQKHDLPLIVVGEGQELESTLKTGPDEARSYHWSYEVNMNAMEEFILDIKGQVEKIGLNDPRKFVYDLKCVGKKPEELEIGQ